MAQQTLQSTIVLNGRVDSSVNTISAHLDSIANRLMAVGGIMTQLSQPLIDLGKDSVDLYVEFEDHMKYIQGLGELTTSQMGEVEAAAREAGKTTRYTASQAAEAMELNAVAGIDYKDSIAILSDELTLAAAGNLELEDASNQLLTALTVTNTPLEEAGGLIDKIVKTAASSKSDVGGLGEAIQRLGTTMNYLNGGSTEMLTIFGALGDLGAENAEMGTWARNVLLSLIAPTVKSSEVLAQLGYSVDEVDEALDGLNNQAAQELMDSLGLEVYDRETGELRGLFDILTDLDTALSSMTSEERNRAMATIFNKRTLGYAEGLMRVAASGEWRNLYANIADSEGYAERVAAQRESGLGGTLRRLSSEFEEIKLTAGEFLSPQITAGADAISGMFGAFTSLDEASKARVLSVLEGIAVAGPAMLAMGSAFKLLAFAATPGGALALATAGLVGLKLAMEQVADVRFGENFGTMELDMAELGEYVDSLGADFAGTYAQVTQFDTAAGEALSQFAELRSQLGGELLTNTLTGAELSDADKQALATLGGQMMSALEEGMTNAAAASQEMLNSLEGYGLSEDSWSLLTGVVLKGYDEDKATLERLGSELYEALMGDWTQEETARRVNAVISEIDAMAQEQAERTTAIKNRALVEQAQFVNQDNAQEYFDMLGGSYSEALADFDVRYANYLAELWQGIQEETDPQKRAELEGAYREAKGATEAKRREEAQPFAEAAEAAVETIMANSGLGQMFDDMRAVVSGESTMAEFAARYNGAEDDVNRIIAMLQPIAQAIEQSGIDTGGLGAFANGGNAALNWLGLGSDFGAEYNKHVTANSFLSAVGMNTDILTGGRPSGPDVGGDPLWAGVTANVEADTAQLQSDIQLAAGAPYMLTDLGADTQPVDEQIDATTGEMRTVPLDADTRRINSELSKIESTPITIPARIQVSGPQPTPSVPGYAEGGRADTPSIFGEAGAEWAIPERHTARTATLLKQAAEASGFSLAEVMSGAGRASGVSDGRLSGAAQIVFAPSIRVSDSAGLAGALERAQRSFFNQLKREEIIGAATRYS